MGTKFSLQDPVNPSGDTFLHELLRKSGWTAVLEAILESNTFSPNEISQLLNAKNLMGNTVLHVVCSRGLNEYVKPLLHSNADPVVENYLTYTPLHMAIEMNHLATVNMLL